MSKLDQFKEFLRKEGGGGGGAGGDGGGDGGGLGTVATVESSGFTPTYSGGKKDEDITKEEGTPTTFAKALVEWALIKDGSYGLQTQNMNSTALSHTPNDPERGRTRSADISRSQQYHVISPPEIPFQNDPVMNWEDLFQKDDDDYEEPDEDINLSTKVLIRDKSGKILILKDAYSDWWDLPGGHLHDAEDPDEGAQREVYEETQLQLPNSTQVMAKELMLGEPGKEEARVVLFFVSYLPTDGVDPHISEEHTDHAWVEMIETHYYNLGVFGPVIRYIMRFMFEGDHTEDNPYVETQSKAISTLHDPIVIGNDDGDLTVLESNGQVNLVKPNGEIYQKISKAEPWPSSEEEGPLSPIERDDFLEKDRVYLHPGETPPQGVQVQTGPSGGRFYDSQVSPGMPELNPTDRPETKDELEYQGLDPNPKSHPDRVPGGTTEWDRLNDHILDADGNGPIGRTLKALGMEDSEWDDKFNPQWVEGSDDEKYGQTWISSSLEGHSVALQYAAANLFYSDKSRVDKMAKHFQTDMLSDDEIHGDKAQQEATKYLKDSYANTQRSFEERGIKELKLYRGIRTGGQAGVKPGERVAMKDIPLSSWTADPSTANGFGDTVISRTFDVRDIVMSMMDKMPSSEFEFMVHTPDTGFESTIQYVSYNDQR